MVNSRPRKLLATLGGLVITVAGMAACAVSIVAVALSIEQSVFRLIVGIACAIALSIIIVGSALIAIKALHRVVFAPPK